MYQGEKAVNVKRMGVVDFENLSHEPIVSLSGYTKETIYIWIRKERIARGISQKKLSELAGVCEMTIQNYERNKRKPKEEIMQRIIKSFGIDGTIEFFAKITH